MTDQEKDDYYKEELRKKCIKLMEELISSNFFRDKSMKDSLDKIDEIIKKASKEEEIREDNIISTSGGCICSYCGKRYDKHEKIEGSYSIKDNSCRYKLCDGTIYEI